MTQDFEYPEEHRLKHLEKPIKTWTGTLPTACDTCNNGLKSVFYDARTHHGVWGILCRSCFKLYGLGLGIGYGQEYDLETGRKLRG